MPSLWQVLNSCCSNYSHQSPQLILTASWHGGDGSYDRGHFMSGLRTRAQDAHPSSEQLIRLGENNPSWLSRFWSIAKKKKKWYKFDSTERILLIYKLPLFSQKDNERRKRKGTKGIPARNTEYDTWKAVGNKKLLSFCWGWRYLEDLMGHQNFFTMRF